MTGRPAAVLRVLTRNLYVGGDLVGLSRAEGPDALAAAVERFLLSVAATRFDVRAGLLAAEIAESGADVVGVQEAALWRTGPAGGAATEVAGDWLETLLGALVVAGAPFDVAAVGEAADLTVPAAGGLARLTMRDAVLVRRGACTVHGSDAGRFAARLERVVGGTPFAVDRGWVRARLGTPVGDVEVVATHLDSIDAAVAERQADEVLRVLGDGPAVVLLDANSGPSPADEGAWARLCAGGLTDAWPAARPGDPGHTFGLSERADDPDWSGLVARLDHVLVRGLGVMDATVTGTDRRDEATGLWASDHAGVLATLAPAGTP